MIIKLSIAGQPSELDLSQFTGNAENAFSECIFRVNDGCAEADAWFIVEDCDPSDSVCVIPPGQVHFLSAEASWRSDKFLSDHLTNFLGQFDQVHISHPARVAQARYSAPFLPWMINANHGTVFAPHERDFNFFSALKQTEKEFPLSVFCSTQDWTPEHRLRLSFVEHLKDQLGEDLAWFGNGVNPVEEKWDGLAKFERTLVLENRSDRGIYSEKILDPYLALTAPIYWGAPDINRFLPVPTKNQINIRSFTEATNQIREIISKPVTEAEKRTLVQGKKTVLGDLHFLSRIAEIAKKQSLRSGRGRQVEISPRESFSAPPSLDRSPSTKAKEAIYKKMVRPFLPTRTS